MELLEEPDALRMFLAKRRAEGKSIGLVPTMGALHAGHLSLVDAARKKCDLTVVTVFVNPQQFGPNEDFERYPRTLELDRQLLQQAQADVLFLPSLAVIYPPGFSTFVEPPKVAERWEGAKRPGHFRGVATIVLKLLQLVPCDIAFFGQKDFQQVKVIEHMARDLNLACKIECCPTIREADGLAMSSRNRYLAPPERNLALGISKALRQVQAEYQAGESRVEALQQRMLTELHAHGIHEVDYAVVVDAESLEPLERVEGRGVALIAARVGTTRLLDNILLQL